MNQSIVLKTVLYLLISTAIGMITQLDTYNFKLDDIEKSVWFAIIAKSFLPGLITIKALFDVPATLNNKNNG